VSALRLAQIHNAEVDMQALITKRLAMVAANHAAEIAGEPMKYSEEDFERLAEEIRGTAVPQEHFRD
jgi:hypothetical protein